MMNGRVTGQVIHHKPEIGDAKERSPRGPGNSSSSFALRLSLSLSHTHIHVCSFPLPITTEATHPDVIRCKTEIYVAADAAFHTHTHRYTGLVAAPFDKYAPSTRATCQIYFLAFVIAPGVDVR